MNLITCSETRRRRSISVMSLPSAAMCQQDVEAVVELAHCVGEAAAAHLLGGADLSAAIGYVFLEALDQLVEVRFFNVRPDDEHDFVGTIHRSTAFCEVLLRTVPACGLADKRFGICCVGYFTAGSSASPLTLRLNSFMAFFTPSCKMISTARAAWSSTSSSSCNIILRMGESR